MEVTCNLIPTQLVSEWWLPRAVLLWWRSSTVWVLDEISSPRGYWRPDSPSQSGIIMTDATKDGTPSIVHCIALLKSFTFTFIWWYIFCVIFIICVWVWQETRYHACPALSQGEIWRCNKQSDWLWSGGSCPERVRMCQNCRITPQSGIGINVFSIHGPYLNDHLWYYSYIHDAITLYSNIIP